MTDGSGSATYCYDRRGNVTVKRQVTNSNTTYKIGTTTTSLINAATYYPFGPPNVLTFGNGRTLAKAYDQDYAIDKVTSYDERGQALGEYGSTGISQAEYVYLDSMPIAVVKARNAFISIRSCRFPNL